MENFPSAHLVDGMCGASPVMRELFRQIERVGRSTAGVLIAGESGTGKELVARAIHDRSARGLKPFIALNCSALPAELVESELFGHVRGSFTGATNDHAGLFQAAHGGTLFLNEIGDLALATQAKVLRVLENGEILRVGSTQVATVDVRVIAATNRPLEHLVNTGAFREDLLYRLKVVKLVVPPLRDRDGDIPLLVRYFLDQQERQDGRARELDAGVLEALTAYRWPGNIRELKNMLAAAAVMAEDAHVLRLRDFPAEIVQPVAASDTAEYVTAPATEEMASVAGLQELRFTEARARALHAFDFAFLSTALARHNGNIARTARSLGLHRQSLQKLMARRGIKSLRTR